MIRPQRQVRRLFTHAVLLRSETLTRCDSSGRRSQNQCAAAGKEGNPACGRAPDPFCELCDFSLILGCQPCSLLVTNPVQTSSPAVKPISSASHTTTKLDDGVYIADGDYIKDIEVNDLRNRYLLTKGSTQKMVNKHSCYILLIFPGTQAQLQPPPIF